MKLKPLIAGIALFSVVAATHAAAPAKPSKPSAAARNPLAQFVDRCGSLLNADRFGEAEAMAKSALQRKAFSTELFAYACLGDALMSQARRKEAAMAYMQATVVEANGIDPEALDQLRRSLASIAAEALLLSGQPGDARDFALWAFEKPPSDEVRERARRVLEEIARLEAVAADK